MKIAPSIERGQLMLRITGVTCPRDKCYAGERGAASERQPAVFTKAIRRILDAFGLWLQVLHAQFEKWALNNIVARYRDR